MWPLTPKQRKKAAQQSASWQRLKRVWREREKKALGG
jgi:hypothetical protein